ncbi:MAG: helix-turn-helix domain-containing protein [Nitrospinae bacterium]|nr:helix-turn-helix domain-containing protein [Nitrospinota bacterium]
MLSVGQVLEKFKIPKTTLYRKMESGEISFKKQNGKRVLDPAEVERAFPQWNKREFPTEHNGTNDGNSDLVDSLRDNIRILERSNASLESSNEDLRNRLDRAENERGQVLRLLTDQRSSSADDPPPKNKKKKSKKGKGKKKKSKKS